MAFHSVLEFGRTNRLTDWVAFRAPLPGQEPDPQKPLFANPTSPERTLADDATCLICLEGFEDREGVAKEFFAVHCPRDPRHDLHRECAQRAIAGHVARITGSDSDDRPDPSPEFLGHRFTNGGNTSISCPLCRSKIGICYDAILRFAQPKQAATVNILAVLDSHPYPDCFTDAQRASLRAAVGTGTVLEEFVGLLNQITADQLRVLQHLSFPHRAIQCGHQEVIRAILDEVRWSAGKLLTELQRERNQFLLNLLKTALAAHNIEMITLFHEYGVNITGFDSHYDCIKEMRYRNEVSFGSNFESIVPVIAALNEWYPTFLTSQVERCGKRCSTLHHVMADFVNEQTVFEALQERFLREIPMDHAGAQRIFNAALGITVGTMRWSGPLYRYRSDPTPFFHRFHPVFQACKGHLSREEILSPTVTIVFENPGVGRTEKVLQVPEEVLKAIEREFLG